MVSRDIHNAHDFYDITTSSELYSHLIHDHVTWHYTQSRQRLAVITRNLPIPQAPNAPMLRWNWPLLGSNQSLHW